MKNKEFICTNDVPELNEQENKPFFLNVEFAVLISLVKRGLLTRSQNDTMQANSFESQQRYFRQYIQNNPDWELYGIFADEGISGTNTKKRKEFQRMIDCAENGDFDLIITAEKA